MGLIFHWLVDACVLGLVTFTLGLVIGNRLAIGRDRRVEWNDLIQGFAADLDREIRGTHDRLDQIPLYLPFWRRRGYSKALRRYEDARCKRQNVYASAFDPVTGEPIEGKTGFDPAIDDCVKQCATSLRRYLRPR